MSLVERVFTATGRLAHSPLLRSLSIYSLSASLAQVVMMVYTLVIARYLGRENYGLYAGNYALASLTIFIVSWGMDTWMLRESGSRTETRSLTGTVLQTKLLLGFLWVIALVLIAPALRPELFPPVLMLVCALDVLFDTCLVTLVSGFNLEKQTNRASMTLFLVRLGRLAGAIFLILIGNHQPFAFVFARGLATFAGFVSAIWLLKPLLPGNRIPSAAFTLRASFAYGLPDLIAIIYAQADVSLMGFLKGKAEVGEYSPAVSLVNALFVVPSSVFYILVPNLSRIFQNEAHKFKKAVWQMSGIYALLGIALFLGTILVAKPVLVLFLGESFQYTGEMVKILSPILFLKPLSFACTTYLVVVNWQTKRIIPQIVSAAVNVGLNWVFIPIAGLEAAAHIYVLSEVILLLGYGGLVLFHYQKRLNSEAFAA